MITVITFMKHEFDDILMIMESKQWIFFRHSDSRVAKGTTVQAESKVKSDLDLFQEHH